MAKRYVGYVLMLRPHETRKQNIANRHHKPAYRSQHTVHSSRRKRKEITFNPGTLQQLCFESFFLLMSSVSVMYTCNQNPSITMIISDESPKLVPVFYTAAKGTKQSAQTGAKHLQSLSPHVLTIIHSANAFYHDKTKQSSKRPSKLKTEALNHKH